MNYLAHLYLSGNDEQRMIGNFIADHVKGKAIHNFPEGVKEGIFLHRRIDEFTDSHPVVAESKLRLRSTFHKYAPVIVDVFYDHFLARDWLTYHHQALPQFAAETYELLQRHDNLLPDRTRYMLGYMSSQNWLLHYSTVEGIHKALSGMARRTSFSSGMENAAEHLSLHYDEFGSEFNRFFADLRSFVALLTS